MFKSEPICILKAGPTIDGRDIPQKVIDDIAETYDPKKYTARINDNHSEWSWKGGSVLSVEKRDDELWAEIKPNSYLLRNIESGQLLHTSCEYREDFANTGKAYLTGLAFTDNPASLGTTQVHLSAQRGEEKAQLVSTGQTINYSEKPSQKDSSTAEQSLLKKILNLLTSAPHGDKEQLSKKEESEEMSKEIEELLKQSVEQNQKLSEQLGQLVEKLSVQDEPEPQEEPKPEANPLADEVKQLSSKLDELTTKLSQTTDEQERNLAGEGGEDEQYL